MGRPFMDGLMRVESAIYHWRSGEYVQAQGFQPVFYGLPEAGVQPVVGHAVCERGAGQIEQRPCRGFRRRDQRQQGHAQGLQRQALRHQPPVGLLQGGQSFSISIAAFLFCCVGGAIFARVSRWPGLSFTGGNHVAA